MLDTLILNNFRGINRIGSRLNTSPDFAWNILNGYVKKDIKSGLGIINQRLGIEKFNTETFTNSCKYIFEAKWNGGSTDVLIREGTRWAKFDGVDTFDDFDTGRTDGVRGQAVMFGNELIMVDGGTPRKSTAAYSLSNLCADAAMPTDSNAVHVHQHKVWLNSSSNPMKAYYSKTDSANAADSFSASGDAGSIDFSRILPFGDRLIGFATFAEAFLVFVFTKNIIVYSAGTDPADFALNQIVPLNCISGHGVQQIGNDLAVTSLEGINSFRSSLTNQDLDIDDLSRYIAPLYREFLDTVSDNSLVSSAFSHNNNHLYICLPATEHTILVYSLDIKNFVGVWQGYKCHSIIERQDGTMLVGGDGYLYIMNKTYTDDGETINWSYDFPHLYAGDANSNKSFRQIEGLIQHEGSPILNIDYNYSTDAVSASLPTLQIGFTSEGVDWDSPEAIWDVAEWAGGSAERFLSSDVLGRGKQLTLSLSNYTNASNVEIPYIILRYKKEGIKVR